ncbi:hypothetical protein [Amycolatopsis samaneae]|uniref:Uncharacterized protein n=1 Tax=Amycolatopsis samaneae TaxID=664691 RepID=A0ABW5GGK8_9PSEU
MALTVGALLLAGGAVTAGTALATDQPTISPSPAPTDRPTSESPAATPGPAATDRQTTKAPAPAPAGSRPTENRVPKAIPAGPVGATWLPAIGEVK